MAVDLIESTETDFHYELQTLTKEHESTCDDQSLGTSPGEKIFLSSRARIPIKGSKSGQEIFAIGSYSLKRGGRLQP